MQLPRVDFTRQQAGLEHIHGVNREPLVGSGVGFIDVVDNADTDIEPGIAIQVIVAQIALYGVTAAAANNDFRALRRVNDGGVEWQGGHLRRGQAQQFGKAIDQTDVL